MMNIHGLKSNYINVIEEDGSVSFGGNQGWVVKDSEKKRSRNNIIRKFGCGLVSAVDIVAYMERASQSDTEGSADGHSEISKTEETPLTVDEYRERLHELEKRIFHVSYWLGVPGTRLARRMNRLFRKKNMPYKASWGMSGKKLLSRVRDMLENDIPVTLGIGPGFFKKDRVHLYVTYLDKNGSIENGNLRYSLKRKGSTKDHYVTITGLLEDDEKTYFEISSWGRRYYIDYDEYTEYVKKNDNYIFSNILWIRKKKEK